MERIVSAAIKDGNRVWTVKPPGGHDAVRAVIRAANVKLTHPIVDGFQTASGEFLTRNKAYFVAKAAGQLRKENGMGELYSPDVIW